MSSSLASRRAPLQQQSPFCFWPELRDRILSAQDLNQVRKAQKLPEELRGLLMWNEHASEVGL